MPWTIVITSPARHTTGSLGFIFAAFPKNAVYQQCTGNDQSHKAPCHCRTHRKLLLLIICGFVKSLKRLAAAVKCFDLIGCFFHETRLLALNLMCQADYRMV